MRRASLRAHCSLPVTFRMQCQIAACCGNQKGFCALIGKPEHVCVQLWAKAGLGLDSLDASYEKA